MAGRPSLRVNSMIVALLILAGLVVAAKLWTEWQTRKRRQRRRARKQRNMAYQRLWERIMLRPKLKQLVDGRPRERRSGPRVRSMGSAVPNEPARDQPLP